MPGLVPGIHDLVPQKKDVDGRACPRLSGSILMDWVHGMDSSVF